MAVVNFGGEHGNAVSAAVSARLWNADFHTVVDGSQFNPIRTASLSAVSGESDPNVILAAAREARVDGVLMGDVIDYHCEDQEFSSTHFGFGQSEGANGRYHAEAMGIHFSSEDTLIREGTVTVSYKLINPETGEMLATDTVSRSFEGRLVNGNGTLPSQGEVLDNLLNECAGEIVAALAPHEVSVEVQLVTRSWWQTGSRVVRRGVDAAERGDWDAAESAWSEALEEDAENDAALFNLAWLAARNREFETAEELAMQALCIRYRDEYATGLEEIRRQRDEFVTAQRQRDALTTALTLE